MQTLHLVLKKRWFDLISSGDKKEEYRDMSDHWITRLVDGSMDAFCATPGGPISPFYDSAGYAFKHFNTITFQNGYAKDAPRIVVECKGMEIGKGKPEWGGTNKNVFIIKLGDILHGSK